MYFPMLGIVNLKSNGSFYHIRHFLKIDAMVEIVNVEGTRVLKKEKILFLEFFQRKTGRRLTM